MCSTRENRILSVTEFWNLFHSEYRNCENTVSEERALEILRDNCMGPLCEKLCQGELKTMDAVRKYVSGLNMKNLIQSRNSAGIKQKGPTAPKPSAPTPVTPAAFYGQEDFEEGEAKEDPSEVDSCFYNGGEKGRVYTDPEGKNPPPHPRFKQLSYGVPDSVKTAQKGTEKAILPRPKWVKKAKGEGWQFYNKNDFAIRNKFWTPSSGVAPKFLGSAHPDFEANWDMKDGEPFCRFCKNEQKSYGPHIAKECWKIYCIECGLETPKTS